MHCGISLFSLACLLWRNTLHGPISPEILSSVCLLHNKLGSVRKPALSRKRRTLSRPVSSRLGQSLTVTNMVVHSKLYGKPNIVKLKQASLQNDSHASLWRKFLSHEVLLLYFDSLHSLLLNRLSVQAHITENGYFRHRRKCTTSLDACNPSLRRLSNGRLSAVEISGYCAAFIQWINAADGG